MEMIYCPNCAKLTGFKRALGFGTFFMVLLTLGLWLLVIPLYPARCINCGLTRGSAFWTNLASNPKRALTVSSVIGSVAVLGAVAFLFFSKPASGPDDKHPAPIVEGPDYNEAPPSTSSDLINIPQAGNTATPTEEPSSSSNQGVAAGTGWPNVSALGFRAGESAHEAGVHVGTLGLTHVGDCKYRQDFLGTHAEYVDCVFTDDGGQSLEASFYEGSLQRLKYEFLVDRYEGILEAITKDNGPSRTLTSPSDPSFIICQMWGGVKEGYDISVGKTVNNKRGWASIIFWPPAQTNLAVDRPTPPKHLKGFPVPEEVFVNAYVLANAGHDDLTSDELAQLARDTYRMGEQMETADLLTGVALLDNRATRAMEYLSKLESQSHQ